jgi:two-component system cell cycle sensor histidine kinase/response regulator CckA
VVHIWTGGLVVSTPKRKSETLRPTEAARLELARYVPEPGHTLTEVFRRACELAAQAIEVERVSVWLFVENNGAIRCVNLFERSKNEHSAGAILRVAEFPKYFSSLKLRRAVPAELATSDPRTAELADAYLLPLGISSMLDAAIHLNGEIVGVVCHEQVGAPREWTTEARDFAASVADLVALKMKGAELRELKEAFRTQEDRMIALEKADALAEMAAGVAHDFNNLLGVIAGHAEFVSARIDLPADIHTHAREIAEAADRGAVLVKELLEFARPNGATPTALNPADAMAAFMPILRSAVGLANPILFDRPVAVGHVLIDKVQFTRVILNLAMNARDASRPGEPIRIRIAPVKTAESRGAASHFVLLEVADRGTGMDEATMARLFEPFFTTKPKGTGLGTAIVRRIVDHAGGFVRVESAPGAGTTVRVFLPRVGASSGGTTEFPIPPELFGPKK